MAEPHTAAPPTEPPEIAPLRTGERLDQKTFHERYEAMPPNARAELIEGVVYMPSPLTDLHGESSPRLTYWLMHYRAATPGTAVRDNTTAILGERSEPQPDSALLLLPECGGQTYVDANGYRCGAPELVAEIAFSSESFDLGPKFRDYQRAGVREYLVVLLRRQQVRWFVLREGSFQELAPGPDGILHSEVFPGLWLDPPALLRDDIHRLIEVLNQGLASPEHARFVERMRRP